MVKITPLQQLPEPNLNVKLGFFVFKKTLNVYLFQYITEICHNKLNTLKSCSERIFLHY